MGTPSSEDCSVVGLLPPSVVNLGEFRSFVRNRARGKLLVLLEVCFMCCTVLPRRPCCEPSPFLSPVAPRITTHTAQGATLAMIFKTLTLCNHDSHETYG